MEQVARRPELVSPRPRRRARGHARGHAAVAMSWRRWSKQGVAKGREVLVVDQNLCANCQNCVDACGRRHGYSRLQLRGLQVENLLFPTACRHCEDPVCLLCSVNGIVRMPERRDHHRRGQLHRLRRVRRALPYGNISMHPVDPPKMGSFLLCSIC